MLRTIILLSFISLVVSENTTNTTEPKYQGTHGACAYKRSASDNKVLDLFIKEGENWVLGQCSEDDDSCRDFIGGSLFEICERSEDNCKDYKEGTCKTANFEDWTGQWLFVAIGILACCCYCCRNPEEGKSYLRINK